MFTKSQKFKLAILPILACVLGFLLKGKSDLTPPSIDSVDLKRETLVSLTKEAAWPEFQLEEIAVLKPFQTLKQLDQIRSSEGLSAESNPTNSRPEATQGPADLSQVRAIFQTHQGASVLIGDQVFRVGDFLPNGKRIVAIRPDGVEVAGD